ncbi:hypothetical protein B0J14DRAFT_80417 [Halenospora varia]|nr:hypothetical protein B0J14DRAFT_80417 [Halenospora varia]
MSRSLVFSLLILTWTLCVYQAQASWFSPRSFSLRNIRSPDGTTQHDSQGDSSSSSLYSYEVKTSTLSDHEFCTNISSTTSCSTAYKTITTTICSTILPGLAIVTDCSQTITFTTHNTYSIATIPPSPTPTTVLRAREVSKQTQLPCPSPTTFIQDIVSYYLAPWQSVAANFQQAPTNITVLICKIDHNNQQTCEAIKEVWVVHTADISITLTSTIQTSTAFKTAGIFVVAQTESFAVKAGKFVMSSEFPYVAMSKEVTTRMVRICDKCNGRTEHAAQGEVAPVFLGELASSTTRTTTITKTGKTQTVTRTLELAHGVGASQVADA